MVALYFVVFLLGDGVNSMVPSMLFRSKRLNPCFGLELNRSEGVHKVIIGGFRSVLAMPKDLQKGRNYEFRCAGGKIDFCQHVKRVARECPVIRVGSRRIVTGRIDVPAITYQLRGCRFIAGNYSVTGDVHGTTEGVDVHFKIASSGLRHFCHLLPPQMQKNLAFFPENYYNTEGKMIEGLNNRFVRESIMKAIHDHLTGPIVKLTGNFECKTFFRIER